MGLREVLGWSIQGNLGRGVPEKNLKTLHPFSHTLQLCISSIQLFLIYILLIKNLF